MKVIKAILICIILCISITSNAMANNPAEKLSRGLINMLTGWVELPKNIYDTSVEDNIFKGVTIGTVKGIGMTIVRTGAGVYEVVTFPFPVPDNYAMVLEPEFVFSE